MVREEFGCRKWECKSDDADDAGDADGDDMRHYGDDVPRGMEPQQNCFQTSQGVVNF